jgi:hypothetical protein
MLRRIWFAPFLLTITTYGQTSGPAEPPATVGVWHTRLEYTTAMAAPSPITGYSRIDLSVKVDQPVRCSLQNHRDPCHEAGEASSAGQVNASGEWDASVDTGSMQSTYQKSVQWHKPPADNAMLISAGLPRASKVGSGFRTEITFIGALTGTERTVGTSSDGGTFTKDTYSGPLPCCLTDAPPHRGFFKLKVNFDPIPGVPWDPEAPELPQHVSQALSQPLGELSFAGADDGTFFGAKTEYDSQGHFSICLHRKLSLSPPSGASIEANYCGWFTTPSDEWAPPGLPPTGDNPAGCDFSSTYDLVKAASDGTFPVCIRSCRDSDRLWYEGPASGGHTYLALNSLGKSSMSPQDVMNILQQNIQTIFPYGARGLNGSSVAVGRKFIVTLDLVAGQSGFSNVLCTQANNVSFTFATIPGQHILRGYITFGVLKDNCGELWLYQQGRDPADEGERRALFNYLTARDLWQQMADNLSKAFHR